MEKLYSQINAKITVKRTVFNASISVYASYTVIRIHSKRISVQQLQNIIDQIFFFGGVEYYVRFTDLCTVIYCNSSSVCDKYIAN